MWNGNSISTPCRPVFDASQPTACGWSLNYILAKGKNNINKFVVIRWSINKTAYHTDINKMHNSVKLVEDDWCLQRYIWQKDLDPRKLSQEKVIKTLLYGVKSSGNQAERGLRETARLSAAENSKVNQIVQNDIYVDDIFERGLIWDDVITNDLRSVWVSNFEMMQEIGNIRFQRAVIPEGAVNLDINTIDAADTTTKTICVTIYVRFLRSKGT